MYLHIAAEDVNKFFGKVHRSIDNSHQINSKRIKCKSDQLNEVTKKKMDLLEVILRQFLGEKHTLEANGP